MEKILILTVLCSFAVYYLISSALLLLEKRLERARIQQMRRFFKSWHRNPRSPDLSLLSDKSLRLKILIWTKSFRSWTEIAAYAQVLTFTAQLVGGSALVASLICSNYPEIIPLLKDVLKQLLDIKL